MLIETIREQGDDALFTFLRQGFKKTVSWGAIHFAISKLTEPPAVDAVLGVISPALSDKPAILYVLSNGDLVISWKGQQKATNDALTAALNAQFIKGAAGEFLKFYDMQAQENLLRYNLEGILSKARIEKKEQEKATVAANTPPPAAKASHEETFRTNFPLRQTRKSPLVLIIDDQTQWQRLGTQLIGIAYRCISAENAQRALTLYAEQVPEIVFLSRNPTDLDGLELLKQIRKLDPTSFVIVVSEGSNSEDEVRLRMAGAVRVITKPLTRAKLHESLDQYVRAR